MKTSDRGIDLITEFEGLRLESYQCSAKVWTIGYGHTKGVKRGQKITMSQAVSFLRADLEKSEKNVSNFSAIYNFNQNEFDAMVSFAFNVGSINQLVNNGKRSKSEIADKLMEYVKANGQTIGGLVRRRRMERELFLGASVPSVSYSGHVQSIGDTQIYKNGQTLGSVGLGLRLEAIKINCDKGGITYQGHIQDIGWQDVKRDGELCGSIGQSKRLEAIIIKYYGQGNLKYRVHIQDIGWQEWKSDGQVAGTEGQSKRIEAIEIKID